MRAACIVILLSGCGSVARPSDAPPDAPPGDDAPAPDASGAPAPDAEPSLCAGTGAVQLCLDARPREPLTIALSKQLDTDRDSRCAAFTPANAGWCVVAATRIDVAAGATLSAVGSRALVLVATEAMQIDGTVDVASHHLGGNALATGAGAATDCSGGAGAVSGGGAGGSFGTRGGAGGSSVTEGSAGGIAAAPVAATALRGGCRGGFGPALDVTGTAPGPGGGAVYLLAPAITLSETALINASGAGGFGAGVDDFSGAGGGGSGGMIGLESPALLLRVGARMLANGGGGGEGSGCGVSGHDSRGGDGADPRSPTVPALGGRGEADGGNGGDGALSAGDGEPGAAGAGPCGTVSTAGAGGGGGGGGVGVIVLRGGVTDLGAQLSPPRQPAT